MSKYKGPHWSVKKRAAVWRRRRDLDFVDISNEEVALSDSIGLSLNLIKSSSFSLSDTANIGNQKVVIDTPAFTDTGGINKDFIRPSTASLASISDSIGFEKSDYLMILNNNILNFGVFNGIAHDQHFITDTLSASSELTMVATQARASEVTLGDEVGLSFTYGSVLNTNELNLSQLNS